MSWIGDRPLTIYQGSGQSQGSACGAFRLLERKAVLVRGPASNLHLSIQFEIVMLVRSSTTLDVYLAAHILLLADPPFPDAVLQIQLTEYYQELIDHARRVQAQVARAPPYELVTTSQTLLSSLIPRSLSGNRAMAQADPADTQHKIKSLAFIAVALAATAAYLYTLAFLTGGPHKDSEGSDGDGEEEGDDGGSEEEEEEELASGSGAFTNETEDI